MGIKGLLIAAVIAASGCAGKMPEPKDTLPPMEQKKNQTIEVYGGRRGPFNVYDEVLGETLKIAMDAAEPVPDDIDVRLETAHKRCSSEKNVEDTAYGCHALSELLYVSAERKGELIERLKGYRRESIVGTLCYKSGYAGLERLSSDLASAGISLGSIDTYTKRSMTAYDQSDIKDKEYLKLRIVDLAENAKLLGSVTVHYLNDVQRMLSHHICGRRH
ncbi:hypothetical protein COV93_02160 [Candidatus Woesearchaeota archaeon CG11_big_fil_rev_8_21_14_0_20_43_8]|nr:MAG: hypothetical protein COV93_02160 [Candidatus Woesearchaeota archaeon CG11_big_fil_rev_8_21_14_0_20_43_8]PIO07017.1 MAG: hypothetical protein COT47_01865 [Candidatus Woesearchaeota archaeon CG08_land_8_20_14_0_20_43_7]